MDWPNALIEPLAGALLVLFIGLDVFLTVLYARIGSGLLSRYLAYGIWRLFRAVARCLGTSGQQVVSFAGPLMVVIVIITWFILLMTGMALIFHPALGTNITATSGPTSTEFATALYLAGDSMSTVGSAD